MKIMVDVPVLCQWPDYPTGCESVSAVMILQYWNKRISVEDFVDLYLSKNMDFYYQNNERYGPSPYEDFVGDPRKKASYGCMAPVIEKAVKSYLGPDGFVRNTTGKDLPELCETYVRMGIPVLIWASIHMLPTYPGNEWRLKDGSRFTWTANEHCLVLVGYDHEKYYFNDPYTGDVTGYEKLLCEARYVELGSQSLVVFPDK